MPSFTTIRILVLLGFLIFVMLTAAHQRIYSRNWSAPLQAVIYPMNGDGHLTTNDYINSLDTQVFSQIDRWMERESNRYDLPLSNPVRVTLGPVIETLPPKFPVDGTWLDNVVWGLQFRWWAFRNTPSDTSEFESSLTRIRMFVIYHDGEQNKPLGHSLGLQKGLMGLVNAFAIPAQNDQNNIVIAHEILHTVGALDKYEATGQPSYPIGYANPGRSPLFPQRSAEIMAGRIPTSYHGSYMAESLKSVLLNDFTAAEINWIE